MVLYIWWMCVSMTVPCVRQQQQPKRKNHKKRDRIKEQRDETRTTERHVRVIMLPRKLIWTCLLYTYAVCVCIKLHIQCNSLAYDSNRNIASKEYDETMSTVPIRIPSITHTHHLIKLLHRTYFITLHFIFMICVCAFFALHVHFSNSYNSLRLWCNFGG